MTLSPLLRTVLARAADRWPPPVPRTAGPGRMPTPEIGSAPAPEAADRPDPAHSRRLSSEATTRAVLAAEFGP